jgi:hypothetical protein
MGLVVSGVSDIGIAPMIVTTERFEVVAFTDTLIFTR